MCKSTIGFKSASGGGRGAKGSCVAFNSPRISHAHETKALHTHFIAFSRPNKKNPTQARLGGGTVPPGDAKKKNKKYDDA